ncbi:MAG: hypothetical protein BGO69_13555 [Bacteroidetes bacterium 46-16]|nr:MAG: hypothetical protein BGO69_13555 [Bacteroidetes bacterium 46-16]
MKFRTIEYLKRRKAQRRMQHPTDLKTFLEAELTLCHNTTIRKHIKKTLEELEHFPETHPAPEA